MRSEYPQKLTLVSHLLCPYVQRSVMALEELGIEYKRIDIDLGNPPEWFTDISPLGKVPLLLIDDGVVLFESAVIAEFINEIANGDLLAKDSIEKARQRAWIEFASATLDNIGQLYHARAGKAFERAKAGLESKLATLEQNLSIEQFFTGTGFSLVDAAFAPVFRYLDLFEKLLDDDFHEVDSRLSIWRKSLLHRTSVIKAVSPDYQILLADFVGRQPSYLGSLSRHYLAERTAA